MSVVLSCTDDFLPALPEWSSLSNTEWWVSTGSLLPIEFTVILYIIRSRSKLDTFQRRNRYFPFFNWISWLMTFVRLYFMSISKYFTGGSLQICTSYVMHATLKYCAYLTTDGILSSFLIALRERRGVGIHGSTLLLCDI